MILAFPMFYHDLNWRLRVRVAPEVVLSEEERDVEVWRCAEKLPAIPYCKVGRLVRYAESDLEKYIANQRVG